MVLFWIFDSWFNANSKTFLSQVPTKINGWFYLKITNSSASYQGWDGYWENVYHPADVTPTVNPALIAVASSLARHAVSLLNQDPHRCDLKAGTIKAVTSYFRRDHYQGDLIHFNVEGAQLEALVKPLSRTVFATSGVRLLTALQVGSNYDPKEQILRNRIGVLSQLSKPVAFLKWSTNQNTSVQLVWFDPLQRVRAVHTVNITETSKVNFLHSFHFRNARNCSPVNYWHRSCQMFQYLLLWL